MFRSITKMLQFILIFLSVKCSRGRNNINIGLCITLVFFIGISMTKNKEELLCQQIKRNWKISYHSEDTLIYFDLFMSLEKIHLYLFKSKNQTKSRLIRNVMIFFLGIGHYKRCFTMKKLKNCILELATH